MKFGVFHLIWATPLSDIPAFAAREALAAEGLEGTLVTSLSNATDITADDPAVRRSGVEFLKRYVEHAAALGSPLLSGALYGTVFTPHYLTPGERSLRWVMPWK